MTLTRVLIAVYAVTLLCGAKCIGYNTAFDPESAAPIDDGLGDSGPAGFVPAVPCENEGEAQISVEEFTYPIICGCAEHPGADEGKTCTIPAGTTVVWRFAGSEEHNVSSGDGAFGESDNKLAGRFEQLFDTPGSFGYRCTIHTEMAGFEIVVTE